jgi:hypothetical protein
MAKTGTIYKLVCSDILITECYVGSTENFIIRKSHHKSICNNVKCKHYNFPVYQFIREHGGWDNWLMVSVEVINFDIRRELATRERHWVETLQATLNKQVPNRDKKQYHKDNIEVIHQYKNQKHECPCGGRYTTAHLIRHGKTTKHALYEALHKDDPEVE